MPDSQNANPYESPLGSDDSEEVMLAVVEAQPVEDDWRGNLNLTANIVRFVAAVAALYGVVSIWPIYTAFRFYGMPDGWTWMHTLLLIRAVYIPCLVFLAFSLTRYSNALSEFATDDLRLEKMIEIQAKAWLAIALLVGVLLFGLALAAGSAVSVSR